VTTGRPRTAGIGPVASLPDPFPPASSDRMERLPSSQNTPCRPPKYPGSITGSSPGEGPRGRRRRVPAASHLPSRTHHQRTGRQHRSALNRFEPGPATTPEVRVCTWIVRTDREPPEDRETAQSCPHPEFESRGPLTSKAGSRARLTLDLRCRISSQSPRPRRRNLAPTLHRPMGVARIRRWTEWALVNP
jgi:hypothetical protein